MYIIITLLLCLLALVAAAGLRENRTLTSCRYSLYSDRLPDSFSGFRIAHISDLHNAQFGNDNVELIQAMKEARPDIIAITGDLVDSRRTNVGLAVQFIEQAAEIAPCYYVPGNHEARLNYAELKQCIEDAGATVLGNGSAIIERRGQMIRLCGINDPSFEARYLSGQERKAAAKSLAPLRCSDDFSVLLSHRPELFDLYRQMGFDLALCGHAHGGQIRLPRIGGLFAPRQGFLPRYDAGLYCADRSAMIVSRGLGNSLFPFRINNPPELVIVELNLTD